MGARKNEVLEVAYRTFDDSDSSLLHLCDGDSVDSVTDSMNCKCASTSNYVKFTHNKLIYVCDMP